MTPLRRQTKLHTEDQISKLTDTSKNQSSADLEENKATEETTPLSNNVIEEVNLLCYLLN